MSDYSEKLRLVVEKLLIHRGRRNTSCRVFAPSPGARTYSVALEESQVREQFYLDSAQVEKFVETGNDQFVLTDVRAAFRNLDRHLMKKKTAKGR